MAELETDEDLSVILSPFHHWCSLQMFFVPHTQLLQYSLIRMKAFCHYLLNPMVIE